MTDDDRRARGLQKMNEVYGWDMKDQPGDFFGLTASHLFGEIWQREGLSLRDRRLLLIGLLLGHGTYEMLDIQIDSALRVGDLSADELREIAIFLAHYAGWPKGAKLYTAVEKAAASKRD
ncbi:MAG: carboxymuconolactone decarboxylase family protein [Actinomycetota bacterium]